jgi:hypothetical protein
MTLSSSIRAIGRGNFQDFLELEEENLRDSYLVEFHEASYRRLQAISKAGSGAHGTQTVQRAEVQRTPNRIEEWSTDSLLRFRDEWVRNRARDIRQAASISFNACSEDTASVTALNEFYRWRVFDRLKAEHRNEKELEIRKIQVPRDSWSFPKDVAAIQKRHMCRSICREKVRRVFRESCRQRAMSQA